MIKVNLNYLRMNQNKNKHLNRISFEALKIIPLFSEVSKKVANFNSWCLDPQPKSVWIRSALEASISGCCPKLYVTAVNVLETKIQLKSTFQVEYLNY